MCGRFTLKASGEKLASLFDLAEIPTLPARFNIAPTQAVAAVRFRTDHGREMVLMRWGLIPSWANDPKIGNRMINARAETVAEKAAFRSALRQRRCLVVADGFYEWKKQNGKRPYYIRLKNGNPFAFAGLWEEWHAPDGEVIETCTLLTTEANELLRSIHDRMPLILDAKDYDLWLDAGIQKADTLKPLLKPFPSETMEAIPIGRWVNDPKHEGAQCIAPEADPGTQA